MYIRKVSIGHNPLGDGTMHFQMDQTFGRYRIHTIWENEYGEIEISVTRPTGVQRPVLWKKISSTTPTVVEYMIEDF